MEQNLEILITNRSGTVDASSLCSTRSRRSTPRQPTHHRSSGAARSQNSKAPVVLPRSRVAVKSTANPLRYQTSSLATADNAVSQHSPEQRQYSQKNNQSITKPEKPGCSTGANPPKHEHHTSSHRSGLSHNTLHPRSGIAHRRLTNTDAA